MSSYKILYIIIIIIIYRVPYKQKLKMNKDNQYNQNTKCKWTDEKKKIYTHRLITK